MNQIDQDRTFSIPLSFEAHKIAQECCDEGFSNPQRARQIYHNALAVYAVDYYLRLMGFETNWANSDCRDPRMRQLLDVADLDINHIGKIECRPVLSDAEICQIPEDVWGDRIGYVAVKLDPSLKKAKIIGFTKTPKENIFLNQLHSVDELLTELSRQESHSRRLAKIKSSVINLQQWFTVVLNEGWQTVETLLGPQPAELAFAFRSPQSLRQGQEEKTTAIASLEQILQEPSDNDTQLKTADLLVTLSPENIQGISALSKLLQSTQRNEIRCQAAKILGEVKQGNPQAIEALTKVLAHCDDENLRWQTALSLGKVDPGNSMAASSRFRQVNLGINIDANPLILLVALLPETLTTASVLIQVRAAKEQTFLPSGLQLFIFQLVPKVDEKGDCFLVEEETPFEQTVSDMDSQLIQLQCEIESGDLFSIKIVLGNVSYSEKFAF